MSWLNLYLETKLLRFLLTHRPGARAAIICKAAQTTPDTLLNPRLLNRLFNTHGLVVDSEAAPNLEPVDLFIATEATLQTLDFACNFLLCDGHTAQQIIQYLNYLARYNGYVRYGQFYAFRKFEMHVVTPYPELRSDTHRYSTSG